MFCAFACFSLTSLAMAAAFSRMAVATLSHLGSWSGVILSAVFSIAMRCSTFCGLLDVAAAAAGGLVLPGLVVVEVWADAPITPRTNDAPARLAMASERRSGAVNDRSMDGSFPREECPEKETAANGPKLRGCARGLADLEAERRQRRAHALAPGHRLDRAEPVQHPLGPGRGLHLVAGGELRHLAVIGLALGRPGIAAIRIAMHHDALRQPRLHLACAFVGGIADAQAEHGERLL